MLFSYSEESAMHQWTWKLVVLATILSLPVTQASAGWMDQVGGMINSVGKTKPSASMPSITALGNSDMVAGLKDALRVGSERVVTRLGKTDGFNADKKIHIPLPDSLKTVKSALEPVGMGGMLDDLELRLNRAAEAGTPKAKRIFGKAIQSMNFDDAKKILQGPDDAATRYFKGKMSKPLAAEMRPIIEKTLQQTGAVHAYDNVIGKYRSLPFMPDVKANLTQHVLDLGLAGIFRYMAEEETAIRHNPAKRTTELLRKVFSN